mmetsp:Transcript_31045/g.71770  ORF Transcript_31045/g.71770 Transcript_31045/m.71770 type:complete len:350 (-) Transcript_31045:183-1232(-)
MYRSSQSRLDMSGLEPQSKPRALSRAIRSSDSFALRVRCFATQLPMSTPSSVIVPLLHFVCPSRVLNANRYWYARSQRTSRLSCHLKPSSSNSRRCSINSGLLAGGSFDNRMRWLCTHTPSALPSSVTCFLLTSQSPFSALYCTSSRYISCQSIFGVSVLTSHSKPSDSKRGSRSFFILPFIWRCLITQMPRACPASVMKVLRTRVWPHCALNLTSSSKFWSQRSSCVMLAVSHSTPRVSISLSCLGGRDSRDFLILKNHWPRSTPSGVTWRRGTLVEPFSRRKARRSGYMSSNWSPGATRFFFLSPTVSSHEKSMSSSSRFTCRILDTHTPSRLPPALAGAPSGASVL